MWSTKKAPSQNSRDNMSMEQAASNCFIRPIGQEDELIDKLKEWIAQSGH